MIVSHDPALLVEAQKQTEILADIRFHIHALTYIAIFGLVTVFGFVHGWWGPYAG